LASIIWWCHILTFFTADTEENHYEFHELSLHFYGSALNFSVNLGHYQFFHAMISPLNFIENVSFFPRAPQVIKPRWQVRSADHPFFVYPKVGR